MERLDKVLSNMGIGSRKEVKALVRAGEVSVDGKVVKDFGLQVDPYKSEIVVCGQLVEYREFIYLMLNKPAGFVSATEDKHMRTVAELVPPQYAHFEPFPVGRLDIDTEGLLVMTNDGQLAHRLLSPKYKVPKLYYAQINVEAEEEDIEAFAQGVVLDDGYKTMPAKLEIPSKGEVLVTIHEGKFHQVKRMFESVGKEVIYLKRLSMGGLTLDEDLELGEIRELTPEEMGILEGESR
ncbi:MAG: pseudouridine synthase [Eubacteriales bacterium]|nr:pseudouridine synthase [Eubacteriales bacterium]